MTSTHSSTTPTLALEWRHFWYLPLLAALGYATSTLYVYSFGPFIAPIEAEFGWSRAQISLAVTITSGFAGLTSIPVGILIDRIGPRKVGVIGIGAVCCAIALLGTATGTELNWYGLWSLMALSTMLIQAMVWTGAVNSRFVASRGLALAVTLSGAAFAAALFPLIATWLIENYGWRKAYHFMGLGWGALVFPLLALFFRGAQDKQRDPEQAARDEQAKQALVGLTLQQGLRSPALYQLVLACGFFSFTMIGMVVHFIPILTGGGATKLAAAGAAGLIGIFSAIGRLGCGFLIDRLPAYNVGGIIFLLPLISCSILLFGDGSDLQNSIAAMTFGLTLGAEVDVVAYLAARYFGMKNFGALYGAMTSALCLGTAFGPLAAGAFYDTTGNYTGFIWTVAILCAISSLLVFALRSTPTAEQYLAGQAAPSLT